MVIGNKRMEGKRVDLPKPLGVLRTVRADGSVDDAPQLLGAGGELGVGGAGAGDEDVVYEVIGQIRQKLVFKARPKPLLRDSA